MKAQHLAKYKGMNLKSLITESEERFNSLPLLLNKSIINKKLFRNDSEDYSEKL